MFASLLALIFIFFLTNCAPAGEPAAIPPSSTETAVLPTTTPPPPIVVEESADLAKATAVPEPTESPSDSPEPLLAKPEPTLELKAGGVTSGRTEEGAFFLGNPQAPITHIDYSDFL